MPVQVPACMRFTHSLARLWAFAGQLQRMLGVMLNSRLRL